METTVNTLRVPGDMANNLDAWQIGEIQQALSEADADEFASKEDVTALAAKYTGYSKS